MERWSNGDCGYTDFELVLPVSLAVMLCYGSSSWIESCCDTKEQWLMSGSASKAWAAVRQTSALSTRRSLRHCSTTTN